MDEGLESVAADERRAPGAAQEAFDLVQLLKTRPLLMMVEMMVKSTVELLDISLLFDGCRIFWEIVLDFLDLSLVTGVISGRTTVETKP